MHFWPPSLQCTEKLLEIALEIALADIIGFSTAKPTNFVQVIQLVFANGRTLRQCESFASSQNPVGFH
jgi:hypothetical protein